MGSLGSERLAGLFIFNGSWPACGFRYVVAGDDRLNPPAGADVAAAGLSGSLAAMAVAHFR